MNMAVQKITPGVQSLDPDTRRLAALGACALTLFLAAPTRQASSEVCSKFVFFSLREGGGKEGGSDVMLHVIRCT